jgi:hypothetical protein
MVETQENPAAIAAIAMSFLQQGRAIDMLSRGITLIACIAIFAGTFTAAPLPIMLLAVAIVLLGLGEACFALRVGFDAALFGHFARDAFGTVSLDASMRRLDMMPADRAGRSMTVRAAGAMRLMRRQMLALALQVAGIILLPVVGALW